MVFNDFSLFEYCVVHIYMELFASAGLLPGVDVCHFREKKMSMIACV